MKEKIKKSLGILENIDFDVWFSEDTGCGFVTLRHRCVTSTVIELLSKVVDLVAISCTDIDTYRINFMTK